MEEDFQAEGKVCVDQERLKRKSRKDRAEKGRCWRRGYATWSGPAAEEEERREIAEVSSERLTGEQKNGWTHQEERRSQRKERASWRRALRGERLK